MNTFFFFLRKNHIFTQFSCLNTLFRSESKNIDTRNQKCSNIGLNGTRLVTFLRRSTTIVHLKIKRLNQKLT